MSKPWVFCIPGPKLGPGVNPPWRRYDTWPGDRTEHDVEKRTHELRLEHGAARATRGLIEIVCTSAYNVKRAYDEAAQT